MNFKKKFWLVFISGFFDPCFDGLWASQGGAGEIKSDDHFLSCL